MMEWIQQKCVERNDFYYEILMCGRCMETCSSSGFFNIVIMV